MRDSELITEEVTSQEVSAKRVYLKMNLNLTFFPIPSCVFIVYAFFIILLIYWFDNKRYKRFYVVYLY